MNIDTDGHFSCYLNIDEVKHSDAGEYEMVATTGQVTSRNQVLIAVRGKEFIFKGYSIWDLEGGRGENFADSSPTLFFWLTPPHIFLFLSQTVLVHFYFWFPLRPWPQDLKWNSPKREWS